MDFAGKVAIVTGSTSGMGVDEAELLAQHGAKVAVVGRNEDRGREVVGTIAEKGGEAIFVQTDMLDPKSIEALAQTVMDAWGRIDVLVNNAGVFDKYATLLETDESLWNRIVDSNLKAPFLMTKAVLPQMLERGAGSIVNVSSIAGLIANKGGAAYTASKHGLIGLTRHNSSAYAKSGIHVNCVCPGTIVTPLIAEVADGIPKDNVPMRRFGTPREVAELVVFLASDEALFMNGAVVPIDGGFTVQ